MENQTAYVPVAVPAEISPKHPGRVQGIIGIISAFLALLPLPPLFGIVGIIIGFIAMNKGARTIGLIAIILSGIFITISWFVTVGLIYSELGESSSYILSPATNLIR